MENKPYYLITYGNASMTFRHKPDPMTESDILETFSEAGGSYDTEGKFATLEQAKAEWNSLCPDTYLEKGNGNWWILSILIYRMEEVHPLIDEDGDEYDAEYTLISEKAEPYQTEAAVKLAHLRTLRRLIDQNDTDIIDAMIDADVANMETLDPHWNHAVVVHTCGDDSLDIGLTTVKAPGSTGVYESSGWVIYVSRMGGDDLSEWLASTGVQLPDDDDPDYNSKRAEVIGAAMDSYRESAFYEDYEAALDNAMKELNAEIIRAER